MTFKKLALLFGVATLPALNISAQQQMGAIATPQVNSTFYVGTITGLYPSIQSAVTAACLTPGATVDIPAGTTPTDSIGVITGGCVTAGIVDERTLPADVYKWVSPTYILQSSGGGANFPGTRGLVVNTSTSASRTATSSDLYNSVQYTQGEDLWVFGDSIAAADTQGPSSVNKGFFAALCRDYGGACHNDAAGGTMSPQIATTVLGAFIVTDYNAPTRVMVEGGINDYINNSSSTGGEQNFIMSMQAAISWAGIPYNQKIMASQAVQSGGTWTSATNFFNAQNIAGVTGTWMQGTTIGSSLTFTVDTTTVGSVGNSIGIFYQANTNDIDVFNVSIDGVHQTNSCTGTQLFQTTGCSSVSTGTSLNPFEQIFPVTGAGPHTVVIAISNASTSSPLFIGGIDVAPTSPILVAPLVIVPGIPMQLANADATDSAAYNVLATNLATAMKARNINLLFVDLRGGNPGVNDTTDMGSNSLCGSLNPGVQHFNDCGSFHYALTVENAASFDGIPFTIPNSGQSSGSFNVPLTSPGNPNGNNVGGSNQDWKPATKGVPGLNGFSSGIELANNGSTFMLRISEGLDADGHFSLMNMILGGFWGVYSCNTPFPTVASQCPSLFLVDQGTGNVTEKFGTFFAPEISVGASQPIDGVQGSTGTDALMYAGAAPSGTDLLVFDANGNASDSGIIVSHPSGNTILSIASGGWGFQSPGGQGGSFGSAGATAFGWDAFNSAYIASGSLSDGSASNTDMSGSFALTGGVGTRAFTFTRPAAPAVCLAQDVTSPTLPAIATTVGSPTVDAVLTITGTGSDVVKYLCITKNPFI